MPPADPRLSPDLEPSRPADLRPGSTRVTDWPEPWAFQFGGSSRQWCNVSVRAYSADTRGRELVDIEWHIDGFTWSGTYVTDHAKMRKRW